MSWQDPRVLFISADADEETIARRVVTTAVGPKFVLDSVSDLDELLLAVDRSRYDVLLIGAGQGSGSPLELKREVIARGCDVPVVLLNDPDGPGMIVRDQRL